MFFPFHPSIIFLSSNNTTVLCYYTPSPLQDNNNSLWRRQWQATPVLLPGKSHGWRSLVGCSPWGRYESDATERLHFHFSLSHNGEGNGNPLQCSCLENPRDGRAWWAAVYGVAQSRTRLKQLSSSSSNCVIGFTNCRESWESQCLAFLTSLIEKSKKIVIGNCCRISQQIFPKVESRRYRIVKAPVLFFLQMEKLKLKFKISFH